MVRSFGVASSLEGQREAEGGGYAVFFSLAQLDIPIRFVHIAAYCRTLSS